MNDRREDGQLSTADMVATANRQMNGSAAPEQPASTATTPNGQSNGAVAPAAPESERATTERPVTDRSPAASSPAAETSLLTEEENRRMRTRWEEIQTGFVDEPRQAVEQADHLVAETMKRIAELFAEERQGLEAQWNRGDAADTEALRMALKRYRSFFERLLST